MDFCKEIAGHTLEYYDVEHQYIVDGICVPSITQILSCKFGNKYSGVSDKVLQNAAIRGTAVHKAIEDYCISGAESDLQELRNFKFLQKQYEFEVLENETPVILFKNNKPISAGRLDLVLKYKNKIVGADIKCTAKLDREYVAYQLNLYKIAYRQCYGIDWKLLRAVYLKDDKRKFAQVPINETGAWELIEEYERFKY